MPNIAPCILDTLAFSGLGEAEMKRRALSSRSGLELYKHDLSFVRHRVTGRDPAKPSLIVLPDGPATIESYDGFIYELANEFNIAVIEVPGFGFSYPISSSALEFEAMSQVLAIVIADLSLPRTILVGPCVQGLIAARIAEIVPASISGLIIAQTGDMMSSRNWTNKQIDPAGNLSRPFEGQVQFRFARERATVDWWTPHVAGPNLPIEQFQEQARQTLQSGCCYALASLVQNWGAMTPLPQLSPNVPTAVIWGLADASHTETDRRSILNIVPNASYLEQSRLGHFVDLEAPVLIAATARKLLDSTVSGDDS